MTLNYIANNPCIIAVNTAWGNTNIEGYRKGMYTQIFAMFVIYFLSQILHTFKYKNNNTKRRNTVQHSLVPARISEINQVNIQQNQNKLKNDQRPDLPWNQKRWNRNFSLLFSNHAIALGTVILFSPLPAGLAICYLHLVFFIGYIVSQILKKFLISNILKVLIDLTNITLLIIGIVGINNNGVCKNQSGGYNCCAFDL